MKTCTFIVALAFLVHQLYVVWQEPACGTYILSPSLRDVRRNEIQRFLVCVHLLLPAPAPHHPPPGRRGRSTL